MMRLDPGTTRNSEGRIFPFTQDLRNLLLGQRAKAESLQREGFVSPWVFTHAGKRFKSIKSGWKNAILKAGLPGKIPHDFRRTAVRNLVRAGMAEVVAMKMTGHKTRTVFGRYNLVSQTDLVEAANKLDLFRGTISGTIRDQAVNEGREVVDGIGLNKKAAGSDDPAAFLMLHGTNNGLVHAAAHAAVASRRSGRRFLLLRDLSDQSFGRQHETGNR
jgi:hypothetical protein